MDSLAELKVLLAEPQKSSSIGQILELDLAEDRSVLRALISLWPDNKQMVARVGWDSIGPNSGVITFPQTGDLVLLEYPEDEVDMAVITKRFSSKQDVIPKNAEDGSTVVKSLISKKLWLTSDNRINISKGDSEPSENLVLGQVFKATYLSHLDKLIDLVEKLIDQRDTDSIHTHIGIFGVPVVAPVQSLLMIAEKGLLSAIKADITLFKATDVSSENFLSDISYTEK